MAEHLVEARQGERARVRDGTDAARRLDGLSLDALHFEGPGTDLTVGLLPSSRFAKEGGASHTRTGIRHAEVGELLQLLREARGSTGIARGESLCDLVTSRRKRGRDCGWKLRRRSGPWSRAPPTAGETDRGREGRERLLAAHDPGRREAIDGRALRLPRSRHEDHAHRHGHRFQAFCLFSKELLLHSEPFLKNRKHLYFQIC